MHHTNQSNKSNMSTKNYSYEIEIRDEEGDTYSESFDTLSEIKSYIKSLDHDRYDIVQTWRYLGDKYLGSVQY